MALWKLRTWILPLAAAVLSVGCIGPGGTLNGSAGDVRITINGAFEKKTLTPSGFSGQTTQPTRYCYAQIRQSNPDQLIADGYLGSDGTGYAYVPRGSRYYVRIKAAVEVPSTSGGTSFFSGSVLNGPAPISSSDATRVQTFINTPAWSMASQDYTANGDDTVYLTARSGGADLSGGAFNIADRMALLAAKVRDLEPALRLPNLHTYWTTTNNPTQQARLYPTALMNNGSPYKLSSGRAVFTAAVYGQQGGAPNVETDEYDDGALLETFSHLLFADRSLREDGSSALSLLRRDNDNVYVSRYRQSESTVAFTGGFCDFLAGAALGDSRLMDSYNNAGGTLLVETFDLARHDQVGAASRGEFTRGSIAVSLWGVWKNVLGGGSSGLSTLWAALRSNVALADGTGEFNGATLGCYPSYLVGVKARAGSQWGAIVGELGQEAIPEPTAAYFNGTALYLPINLSVPVNGAVQTYSPDQGRYYDRNQAQAYRFTQAFAGTRTVTMIPTGGQDLYLEVLGPGGWVNGSYASPGSTRTLSLQNLPVGVYAVRVRAGATSGTTNAGFNLSVQ